MKNALLVLGLLAALARPIEAQQRIVANTLPTTGDIAALNGTITLPIPPGEGYATLGVDVTGTWVGTLTIQCAVRSTTSPFVAIRVTPYNSTSAATTITANGSWSGSIGGCQRVNATATAWTSGTATVTLNAVSLGGAGGGGGSGGASADVNINQLAGGSAVGQQTMALSFPVTIASNQTALPLSGSLTNNGAAPAANNLGVLPAVANAAAPTFTEGRLGALSMDLSGALRVAGGGGTQYTNDAALTVASTVGTMAMGRASAAAPTDVSLDNDAVLPWHLRSGAAVTQPTFGGVLANTGNGASGTGVQRFTLANDSTGVLAGVTTVTTVSTVSAVTGGGVASAATDSGNPLKVGGKYNATQPTFTDGQRADLQLDARGNVRITPGTGANFATDATLGTSTFTEGTSTAPGLVYRKDVPGTLVNTTNEATALTVNAQGAQWVSFIDPCSSEVKTTTPISLTTDTVIIPASSGKKNYICSLVVVAGAAEIVSLTEGTGTVCATSEVAVVGSTTDANGLSFAANGGMSAIGGGATTISGIGTNVDTCLNVNTTSRVSGFVTWVQR